MRIFIPVARQPDSVSACTLVATTPPSLASDVNCSVAIRVFYNKLITMPLNKVSVTTLLKEKSTSVFTIPVDASVDAAVSEMNRQRVGSIMVKDKVDAVVGIFTERDVLVRVVSAGKHPKETLLSEVMTAEFKSITPQTTVEDAMQLMTEKRVRHLPILEDGKLCGMLSIGDVTRWLLKVNEMEAENLRKYVFAEYPG